MTRINALRRKLGVAPTEGVACSRVRDSSVTGIILTKRPTQAMTILCKRLARDLKVEFTPESVVVTFASFPAADASDGRAVLRDVAFGVGIDVCGSSWQQVRAIKRRLAAEWERDAATDHAPIIWQGH